MPANSQSGSAVASSHPREAAGLDTAPRIAGNPSASSYWFPERGNRNNTEPESGGAPRPGSRLAGILQRLGPHCAWRHQVTGPLHSPCVIPKSPHPAQTSVQGLRAMLSLDVSSCPSWSPRLPRSEKARSAEALGCPGSASSVASVRGESEDPSAPARAPASSSHSPSPARSADSKGVFMHAPRPWPT